LDASDLSAPVDNSSSHVRGPFTDSGYASALGAIATHQLPPETTKNGDEITVYTGGTSIGDSLKQAHIQELANEIYRQLHLEENRQKWEAISAHAPMLIKAFAIRVGGFFGTSAGRESTHNPTYSRGISEP